MANKYSKYQLQPYVSQYVDPQRTQISSMLRGRYENNLSAHTGISNAVASLKVGAGDQYLKDDAMTQVTNDFKDIAESNNYEDAGLVVQKSQQTFMKNEGLQTATKSYANWEKEKALEAEITMKTGKRVLFSTVYERDADGQIVRDKNGQPQVISKFDQHQSYYQDPSSGEMVKNIYQSTGQAQLQYADKQREIIEQIAGDPVALRRLSDEAGFENPDDLRGYLLYGSEVSDEKAVRIAKALTDVYINGSVEGKQQMLKLTTAVGNGENLNPATGDHWTPEEAEALIQDELIAIARQQVGRDLSYMVDQAYINRNGGDDLPLHRKLQTFNSNATSNSQVVTGLDFISDKDFDANGKLTAPSLKPTGIITLSNLGYKQLVSRKKQHLKVTADSHNYGWIKSYALAGQEQAQLETGYYQSLLDAAGIEYEKKTFDVTVDNYKDIHDEHMSYSATIKRLAQSNNLFNDTGTAVNIKPAGEGEVPNMMNMLNAVYGDQGEEAGESTEVYERQKVRFDREIEAAIDEGRPPRLSILGANKRIYLEYMREQYPEVLEVSKTDQEFFKNLSTLQEKYEVSSSKVYRPTNKYIDGFRKMILSSPTDYIVRRTDGSFTMSIDDLQMELGYKNGKGKWKNNDSQENWLNMMEGATIQGLMTGGQKPGSFAINMTDQDGKSRVVELANSNEAQQQFRAPHEIINDLHSGRAQNHRTPETSKTIQNGQAMLTDGSIVDAEVKVHYEINTTTMEWEPVITQYYYNVGTKTQAIEPEELRRHGSGVIDYLMEQAVSSYMAINHMIGTDMNIGKGSDLTNPK
tara:strand:+ start:3036 stop:5456 length:2421 start_codon:yes stop_codon:yes gene_type:complete